MRPSRTKDGSSFNPQYLCTDTHALCRYCTETSAASRDLC